MDLAAPAVERAQRKGTGVSEGKALAAQGAGGAQGSCPLLGSQHCSFLLQAGHLAHPYSTSFLTGGHSRAALFLSQKSTCLTSL